MEPDMYKMLAAALLSAAAFSASAAETYVIDSRHTFPSFEISHFGLSTFRGRFDKTEGSIVLDRAAKSVKVDVTIDVASISTGVEKLDEHLKAPDFFDAARFPSITFKSTQATFKGDVLTAVTGDLSMHGVTRPVTLKVNSFTCKEHPLKKIPACGADAEATIKRSDWGISTYAPAIGDDVRLLIEVEAHLKKD
jgi:polyisoprenoid-binding protein YceI